MNYEGFFGAGERAAEQPGEGLQLPRYDFCVPALNMRARCPNYGFYGFKQHRAVGREPGSVYHLDSRSLFGFFNRRKISDPIDVERSSHQGWAYSAGAADIKGLLRRACTPPEIRVLVGQAVQSLCDLDLS